MKRNVGGFDRITRTVVGIVALVAALTAYRRQKRSHAAIAAVAGFGLLFNAATCFCGGNYVLGIDTASDSTTESTALEE